MSKFSESGGSRLDPLTLERYFNSPSTVIQLLSVTPRCELRIDPIAETLQLRVQSDSSLPDVGDLANLEVDFIEELKLCSVTLSAKGMHYAAYSFIAQIVEELREGSTVSTAIERSLSEHRLLLQKREFLSEEKQVGLIGELLFLKFILNQEPTLALDYWLGPLAEQHDFSFGQFDLEVKTTRSESRVHRIASISQLESSPNRELWFLSIQITLAGASSGGFSLFSLVQEIRDLLPEKATIFNEALEKVGCHNEDLEYYKKSYVLRSNPSFYVVDDTFPRLRTSHLEQVVPNYEYISDVSYRINVSRLVPKQLFNEFNGFSN